MTLTHPIKWLRPVLFYVLSLSYLPAQQATDGLIIPPFKPVPHREPAFPLKTARSLYRVDEIEKARENIKKYASAKKISDNLLDVANYWVALTEAEILNIMPDARVPRGFDLCAKGCPIHGDSVFKVGGFYPWIIDPKKPLKVTCPIGGESYPSNDYTTYYQSGFTEKGQGDYVDDGWGWISSEGDRYWFVAYANQWMWMNHTLPGILALSRAYLLTGDPRYAHQAAFMLYRLAEVYPSMDHENQSRYGLMEKMKGNRYSGKILNRIWETQLIRGAAEAYDHIWDSIDKNIALQRYTKKDGEAIRSWIEANLLEEGLDAIAAGKIAGNFGMHQNATLHIHLVRQYAGKEAAIEKMTDLPASTMGQNGFNYALYNQVFRDGMPLESPGYNAHWLQHLVTIADVLKRGGRDLFATPRFKQLLDAPLDLVTIGRYTPDWGDGGSAIGGYTARYPDTYQIAYNYYRDKRYLNWIGKSGEASFTTFGSLFMDALPKAPELPHPGVVSPQKSRLFAGYGLGILNDTPDKTALAFTYGMHYSHYHWDFLNIELFANGQKMMPDLGYPDAMNTYVAPVYTWSQNTVSHNTVVVNQKKQNQNLPGKVNDFFEGTFMRSMDASSPAYREANQYRRNVLLVEADSNRSYVVDFFHVAGGTQHDYSLHGPPGTTVVTPDEWTAPAPGTLAGPSVKLEEIYDDEKLRKEGSRIGYSRYGGSGFQHLFNVQRRKKGSGTVEYRHLNDADARLRLHTLTHDLDDLFIADAYDKPRKKDYLLKYLIARRTSKDTTALASTFLSVFEPFQSNKPFIDHLEAGVITQGTGHYVIVSRGTEKEVILHDTTFSSKRLKPFKIKTDAGNAVVTFNESGSPRRVAFNGGSYLKVKGRTFKAEALKGNVESVDAEKGVITIRLAKKPEKAVDDLVGKIAHLTNAYRETVHPILRASLQGDLLTVWVKDDVLVGKLQIDQADDQGLATRTSLSFQRQYNGTSLLTSAFEPLGKLVQLQQGKLQLAAPPTLPVKKGDVLWLSNVGVGDTFEVKSGFSQTLD